MPAGISLASLATAFAGAAGTAVIGNMLGPKGSTADAPAAPAVAAPTPMPTPNDEAARKAKMMSIAAQRARQGRASTILTGDAGDKLGA